MIMEELALILFQENGRSMSSGSDTSPVLIDDLR